MRIEIFYTETDFPIDEFENASWKTAREVSIEKYWSGADAPAGRHFKAKLLWSDAALYVRFEAVQTEPLVVSEHPNLETKTKNLWDRDVCEIFVAPDKADPRKYYEFEIAPTGEWIDLAIRHLPDGRETDFAYDSKLQAAARVEKDTVLMSLKIEWKAFGKRPRAGDVWKGNLLRCVGEGGHRGYLAWRPTMTAAPNFHVPEAFGEFEFAE